MLSRETIDGDIAVTEKQKHGGVRKGAGRPATERDDKAVKIDRTLADMIFVIAKHRKTTIAAYLSAAFKAVIEADYSKIIHEIDKRRGK